MRWPVYLARISRGEPRLLIGIIMKKKKSMCVLHATDDGHVYAIQARVRALLFVRLVWGSS